MKKYNYPKCKTIDTQEDWFGRKLEDPYAWLKKATDPKVLDFVRKENAYTDTFFDKKLLQEKIEVLKKERPKSIPSHIEAFGDGYIANVSNDGKVIVELWDEKRQKTSTLPEIFDLKEVDVFSAIPSPQNENILGVMYQVFGGARPSIAVFDIKEKKSLFTMPMNFNFTWSKLDGYLYFTATETDIDQEKSITSVYSYNTSENRLDKIYSYNGYAIFGHVEASTDGRYIIMEFCKDYSDSYWYVYDTADKKVHKLSDQALEWEYVDSNKEGHVFISMSDSDYGSLIRVDHVGKIDSLMPESQLVLEHGFVIKGEFFVLGKKNVSSRLVNASSGKEVELPSSLGSLEYIGKKGEEIFLRFESFDHVPQILVFDGKEMTIWLKSSDQVNEDIVVEQAFAPSTGDGKMIPYYLVRNKNTKQDGSSPALIYGYGGYNSGMYPWYQEMVTGVTIAEWVKKGGIYIHCNLRGGNEYGPKWHEDGMKMNKKHCFEDFIGITEKVIRDGWTRSGRIGITGCSNGGLLVSALVTMRPELWGCAIDSVPHTDMIHFVEDDRGPMYIMEYGDPRQSKDMFEYLYSYSPYHNIKEADYPPTYIQTGENDNNVPPYHGKKFAARLQEANQSDAPILLRVLKTGSHDRGKGEDYWKTIAEMHLFLEDALMFE